MNITEYENTVKSNVKNNVKDTLFRFLFEKDRRNLLQLYNALNGTDYSDVEKMQVVTIENAVHVTMKNDLAFIIVGTLNLYEHQSTYSPNMPVRFLIYLAEEYQKIIEQAESSPYGTKQILLPSPQCIVFYNGEKDMPEEQILRLSDAYENKEKETDVELKVRLLNINSGHNMELMKKCRPLKEYASFVEVLRSCIAKGGARKETFNTAIDCCIEQGILSDFLKTNRAEVLGMILTDFDAEKYERTLKEEGREDIIKLADILLKQNRIDDLKRIVEDSDYRNQLITKLVL